MLILPYKTDLRLGQLPVVTYSIMIFCLFIHYLQEANREDINIAAASYCTSIYQAEAKKNTLDYLVKDKEVCISDLSGLHEVENPNRLRILFEKYNKEHKEYNADELVKVITIFRTHLVKFQKITPMSWDRALSYDPSTWNPFSMLMSAFAHSDWWHVVFNLIFFYAFAPALELLSRSKVRFITAIILIELACDIPYSIISLSAEYPVPTLGLSGVVMGMIGLSAYLMPWARIKTFVWFLHFAKVIPVPAKILALWYIGLDTYALFSHDEYGGVNLIAHVFGGVAGYSISFVLFKGLREKNSYELKTEIDYMNSKRGSFSSLASTFKGDTVYVDNKLREHDAKKEYGKYNEDLYRFVKSGCTSDALALLIQKYDLFEESPEIYIEIFNNIGEWKKKRVYLCAGRLVIDLLVDKKQYGNISNVLKSCLEVEPDFALSDPDDLIFIVNYLINTHEYKQAYRLITNAHVKYGKEINKCDCILLEAKILWEYLGRTEDATLLISNTISSSVTSDKLVEYLELIEST